MRGLVWIWVLLLVAGVASAEIILVDRDSPCSSSNSCGTGSNNPCCSIQDAFDVSSLGPGDNIQIRASNGKYDGSSLNPGGGGATINDSGSSGNPIVIESAPGHEPVICNSDGNDQFAIRMTNRSHITIRNLKFDCTNQNTSRSVIFAESTNLTPTNIIIEDNEFINIGGKNSSASRSTGTRDKRVVWINTPSNDNNERYNNVTIRRNLFDGFQAAAIRLRNAENGIVEDNEIRNGVCARSVEANSPERAIIEPIKLSSRVGEGTVVRRNLIHMIDDDECPIDNSNEPKPFTTGIYCDTGAAQFVLEYNAILELDSNGDLETSIGDTNCKSIFIEKNCHGAVVRNNIVNGACQCISHNSIFNGDGTSDSGRSEDGVTIHNTGIGCGIGVRMRNVVDLTYADNIIQTGSSSNPNCNNASCSNVAMEGRVVDVDQVSSNGQQPQRLAFVDRNIYSRLNGSTGNDFRYGGTRTFGNYRGSNGCSKNVSACEANSVSDNATAFVNVAINDYSLQKGSRGVGSNPVQLDGVNLNAGAKQSLRLEDAEIGNLGDNTLVLDFHVFRGFAAIDANLHRATFDDTHLPLSLCNQNNISVTYDGVNAPILSATIQDAVGCGNTPGPNSDKCHLSMQSPPPTGSTQVRVSLQERAVLDCAPHGGLAVQGSPDFKTSNEVEVDFTVTNNTAGTSVSPRLISGVVENATPDKVSLAFTANTPPILPVSGCTGFSCTKSGVNWPILSCIRPASLQQDLTMASPLTVSEAVTCSYSNGNITDSGGEDLETSNIMVTNNVLSVGGALLASATVIDSSKNFLQKTGITGIHDEGELTDGDTGGAESLIALPVKHPSVEPVTAFVTWDMGEVKTLDRIELFGDNSGARQCVAVDVLTSVDGVCYTAAIQDADCNQATTLVHSLAQAQGRFVKLFMLGLTGGLQLPEAEIFGQGSSTTNDQVGVFIHGNVRLEGAVHIK